MISKEEHPIITTSHGTKIANFSSYHAFYFDDDTVLPGVSKYESERLTLEENLSACRSGREDDVKLIVLQHKLTQPVIQEILDWIEVWRKGEVSFVVVPFLMLQTLEKELDRLRNCWPLHDVDEFGWGTVSLYQLEDDHGLLPYVTQLPFVTIKKVTREGMLCHHDVFCTL